MLSAREERSGFTLVEVVVALVILSTAVLGLALSGATLTTSATSAELRALAIEAADDRIAHVRLDMRYAALDSLYAGEESNILGDSYPGYKRTTQVTRVREGSPVTLDYTRVRIQVSGPHLETPVSRQITVAAP